MIESPPHWGGGTHLCMIVGEYEQRAVYKRYTVVGNSPDSVLLMRLIVLISKYKRVLYGRDELEFGLHTLG